MISIDTRPVQGHRYDYRRGEGLRAQPMQDRLATIAMIMLLALPVVFFTSIGFAAPPNVVVIMADDLDKGSVDRLVAAGLMPNLKRHLIAQGTRFANAFVTTSLCCPSRATFLTGQYAHNHGVRRNAPPNGGVTAFDDSSTLATWLHGGGYRTGLVGKYLNWYGGDHDRTTPVDNPTYVPPGWDDWQVTRNATSVYDYDIIDSGRVITHGSTPADYQTDVLARRAQQFINESETLNDARPFFLVVTPFAPHVENRGPRIPNCTEPWSQTIRPAPRHQGTLPASITLPQHRNFNEADMSDKPPRFRTLRPLTANDIRCVRQQYRDRLGALRAVDDLIGGIVNALVRNGELANTVLIFTSDNGWFYGEHRLSRKTFGYEESIRIPLFIRAPGLAGPQTTQRMALNTDLAPTIAAFAGVTPRLPVDGRSLIPLLRNVNHIPWRKRFLVEHVPMFLAVRTSDPDTNFPNRLYAEWGNSTAPKELYVLSADPFELNSQHQNPARAREIAALSGWISRLRRCGNGTCQRLEDE